MANALSYKFELSQYDEDGFAIEVRVEATDRNTFYVYIDNDEILFFTLRKKDQERIKKEVDEYYSYDEACDHWSSSWMDRREDC